MWILFSKMNLWLFGCVKKGFIRKAGFDCIKQNTANNPYEQIINFRSEYRQYPEKNKRTTTLTLSAFKPEIQTTPVNQQQIGSSL